MKKFALLIALALCVTVGGVYATWYYTSENAGVTTVDSFVKIEMGAVDDSIGSVGVFGYTDTVEIVVEPKEGTSHTTDLVITGELTFTFTPDADVTNVWFSTKQNVWAGQGVDYYIVCLCNYGYAKWVSKYDERGNRTEVSYYGIDGKPCLHKDGNAKWVSKYDERGNETETSFYGIDGNLCLCNYGYAKFTAQYDDRGNQIATFFYGVDGELCLNIYGYSIQIIECNDRCLVTELSYYDTERKPVNVRGYFKEVRIYDKNNNVKETVYYDKEGKQLAEQIYTRQISYVSSAALAQGVPIGSIVLQFNEWRIGDTQASLLQIERRDKYNEKSVYYLSPTGKIGHLYVKGGLMGISLYDFMVEKNHAQKWLEQLNEWIKNKNN